MKTVGMEEGSSGAGGGYQQGPPPPQGGPPPQQQFHQAPPHSSSSSGKVTVGYYPNWAIYDRKYKPHDIPAASLTHLLYCFADIKTDTGEVVLSDAWSDEQIHYDGDSWDEGGNNLYGNFKAIHKLKQQHRQLKVLISIGGWSYSSRFAPVAGDGNKLNTFVDSAVKLVRDYGLDGLDIDWEYPSNDAEAAQYVTLLRMLRQGLDQLASELGSGCPPFQLTIAAPAGLEQAQRLRIREMDPLLTFWNIMSYDLSGSWDSTANHHAALYGSNPSAPNVHATFQFYLSAGIPPSKLVMGMPLYGRAFEHTKGPGHSFKGVGKGSYEDGTWDYKDLPLQGSREIYEDQIVAASCFDETKGKFVTYDNQQSACAKVQYIHANGLGGAMWWELSGDHRDPSRAIVPRVAHEVSMGEQGMKGFKYALRTKTSLCPSHARTRSSAASTIHRIICTSPAASGTTCARVAFERLAAAIIH